MRCLCAGAASGEEVFVGRAEERGRAGAVVGEDVALEAADADGGLGGVLAADKVRGGGGLVGDRDLGRAEEPSRAVREAAPVLQGRQPGAADRDLGLADPPRAPERVADHYGAAEPRPQ